MAENPDLRLLDVREPWEYQTAAIENSLPVGQEQAKEIIEQWDRSTPIVCVCHHGLRSLQACQFLAQQGFTDVSNLTGGIDAWSLEVDPSIPRY